MTLSAIARSYLGQPLHVLALWQPWATLCVAPDPSNIDNQPAKRHETRHWYPFEKLPLRIAIHATKRVDGNTLASFSAPRFKDALKRCGFYPGDPRPLLRRPGAVPGLAPVPLGAIVGVATVVSVHSVATPPEQAIDHGVLPLRLEELAEDDRAFGYFLVVPGDEHPNRYAWRLADAVMLPKPVEHFGRQQSLYPADVHTLELIQAQLRMVAA